MVRFVVKSPLKKVRVLSLKKPVSRSPVKKSVIDVLNLFHDDQKESDIHDPQDFSEENVDQVVEELVGRRNRSPAAARRVIQARMVLSINLGVRIVTFKDKAC